MKRSKKYTAAAAKVNADKLYMPLASASMIYLIRFDFYRGS